MSPIHKYSNFDHVLKFSYNFAVVYTNHKIKTQRLNSLQNNSPENLAVKITADLLSKNGTGKTKLENHLEEYSADILNNRDFEFYIIKIIRERVDNKLNSISV